MDKFPVLWTGKPAGELMTEQEGLYTGFAVRCHLPDEGLWCAWAVGEQGELRLGILEPQGKQAVIRRRFSDRMTKHLGKLERGELRPAVRGGFAWEAVLEPDHLFHTPWLRHQLRGQQGSLTRLEGKLRYLALPYDRRKPFPLPALFCFACVKTIDDVTYAVFALDEKEWPVFL